MKKKILVLLAGIMAAASLGACGKKDNKDSGTQGTTRYTTEPTTGDTQDPINDPIATGSDATGNDAIKNLMGYYKSNEYYNELAGFKVKVNGYSWKLYSAADVAAAAGVEEKEIQDLWSGETSPYEKDMSICMIAGNKTTGSSIIISYYYVNNELNKDTTAAYYLQVAAGQIEGCEVKEINFMNKNYNAIVIPAETEGGYDQVRYAIKERGLIILISFTIGANENIDMLEAMFSAIK
ncbi:MAG: hypothetical protein IJJ74_01560 [Eubacterium sp.]|nr:hypothetical protein [Eubacterium sp.]